MDFEKLPSIILVNILRYLPLKDQIRVCRVNQRFQEISLIVIPETKSISLSTGKDGSPFYRLDIGSLSKILQLCALNLREIEIYENTAWVVEVFAQFTYPQLSKLDVVANNINNIFGAIINNRNLKYLKWMDNQSRYSRQVGDYPCLIFPNIDCEKLETIEIEEANNDTFRSITGHCRNLKEFKVNVIKNTFSPAILDDFFASCPNLEIFNIQNDHSTTAFQYSALIHFWRLHSMRGLILGRPKWFPFDDDDLFKISTYFPRLENLRLENLEHLTNNGIASLAALKNLRGLFLFSICDGGIGLDLDSGVQQLVACHQLKWLELDTKITSATLIALVQNCRSLCSLGISDIFDVETNEQAASIVQSLAGIGNRNQKITIGMCQGKEVWKSDEVRAALETLKGDGYMIV